MHSLHQRRLLLGVGGGIAAYKSAELVRELTRQGAEVRVVMTAAATEFITPLTLQALSGHPVRQALFDAQAEAGMDHITLARWAELVLIAPATADLMARLALGLADDLLTTLCLATEAPIALAPAMNRQMWAAPATRDNATLLTTRGLHLLGPADGEQACGESGLGRMLEPQEIARRATTLLSSGPLAGVRVVVTAGPTREAIDPVRFISNRSSGRMGYAVAQAAAEAGANVLLVSGPVALPAPAGVERIMVESAEQMYTEVMAHPCDLFIATAAVADYRPQITAATKLKKTAAEMSLPLTRNPDILAAVAALPQPPFTVGFAAETDQLEQYARGKLEAKRLNMIAANWVGERAAGAGFESDENALELFWPGGSLTLPRAAKLPLARHLVKVISEHFHQLRPSP